MCPIYILAGSFSLSRWNHLMSTPRFRRQIRHVVYVGQEIRYDPLIPHAVTCAGYEWFSSPRLCLDFLHHLPRMFKEAEGVFLVGSDLLTLERALTTLCLKSFPLACPSLWEERVRALLRAEDVHV